MRTAAKILNIISLVGYGFLAILLLWVSFMGGTVVPNQGDYSYLFTGVTLLFEFIYIVAGIFIAAMSLKKIASEETKKKDFILWGVLNILFVSAISGVLTLLCMNEASE